MFSSSVNYNEGTHRTNTGKTISSRAFNRRSYSFIMAIIPFSLVFLISTSYQENADDLHSRDPRYFSVETIDALRQYVSATRPDDPMIIRGTNTAMAPSVREFYARNGYRPVWLHYNGLNGGATNLIYLITRAREYGLEPDHYHLPLILSMKQQLEQQLGNGKPAQINLDLEVLLTEAAFRMMVNLHAGYCAFDSSLYASDWVPRLTEVLLHGVAEGQVVENMLTVEPRFIEYTRLRKASEIFVRSNVLTDEWKNIVYPTSDTVKLRREVAVALNHLGYLSESYTDDELTEALKSFQHYHGLSSDGKPGKNTVEALRQSTLFKYRMLALNLNRLRKYHMADSSLIVVNIPGFNLKVLKNNQVKDSFKVIVGHPKTPTPLISGTMDRIIANPVWYVPKKIAINEMLPKIKADSAYLKRNGFKVLDSEFKSVDFENLNLADIPASEFNYTFRQDRGTDNSLGQMKFIFSNPYAVYLHDTPGKALFAKDIRAFSHGCVRVENPERLASYILHEYNSDTTNVSRVIAAGKPREFKVASALPIQIMYLTCEADDAGRVYFFKDIYGKDRKEMEELAGFMGI